MPQDTVRMRDGDYHITFPDKELIEVLVLPNAGVTGDSWPGSGGLWMFSLAWVGCSACVCLFLFPNHSP
jgi:hypothetical protein